MSETYADPIFEAQLGVRVIAFGDLAVAPFDAAAVADRAMLDGRRRNRPWDALLRRAHDADRRVWRLVVLALALVLIVLVVAGRQHPHPVPPLGSRSMITQGVWSPDGSWLAFVAEGIAGPANDRAKYRALYIVAGDGSDVRVLRQLGSAVLEPGLAWSPDSRHIAVSVERPTPLSKMGFNGFNGDADIEVTDVERGDVSIVTRDLPKGGALVGWSPDGQSLLINAPTADGGGDVDLAPVDGGHLTVLTPHHVGYAWSWSPDGRWILYQDGYGPIAGPDAGTWLMTPDGASRTRVTLAAERSPQWSPDGSRLYGWVPGPDGTTVSIMSVRVDGSDLRTVEATGTGWIWSHDGARHLAVADDRSGLLVGAADGPDEHLTNEGTDHDAAWSPDDAAISFEGTRDEGTGVYVIASDGGAARLVAPNATSLGWQPSRNGDHRLAFVRDGEIGIVDTDSGRDATLVARTDISEQVDPPSEAIDDRMTITEDGPDRDSYDVPLASHLVFTIENQSDRAWILLTDEGSIAGSDCHPGPTSSEQPPETFSGGCPLPPHSTVTFDVPHDVDGPVAVTVQPDISGPLRALESHQHRVILDFVPAPSVGSTAPPG